MELKVILCYCYNYYYIICFTLSVICFGKNGKFRHQQCSNCIFIVDIVKKSFVIVYISDIMLIDFIYR